MFSQHVHARLVSCYSKDSQSKTSDVFSSNVSCFAHVGNYTGLFLDSLRQRWQGLEDVCGMLQECCVLRGKNPDLTDESVHRDDCVYFDTFLCTFYSPGSVFLFYYFFVIKQRATEPHGNIEYKNDEGRWVTRHDFYWKIQKKMCPIIQFDTGFGVFIW